MSFGKRPSYGVTLGLCRTRIHVVPAAFRIQTEAHTSAPSRQGILPTERIGAHAKPGLWGTCLRGNIPSVGGSPDTMPIASKFAQT